MDDPTSHMPEEELRPTEAAAPVATPPVETKEKEKLEKDKKEEEKKKKLTPEPDLEDESENDDPTGKWSNENLKR